MNYVRLNLGGKERGGKLGLGFLKYFSDQEKISIQEIFGNFEGMNALFFIPKCIFYSLAYNCKRSSEDISFTEEDVFDWIDEDGGVKSKEMEKFSSAFAESLGTDLGKTEPQKEATKLKK